MQRPEFEARRQRLRDCLEKLPGEHSGLVRGYYWDRLSTEQLCLPFTARVAVNRLWHHHFGSGIADTPSDFAEAPAQAHRHQRSQPETMAMSADAGSRLLWRFPPRRLDAETIHNSILSLSGALNFTIGGPVVNIFKPKGSFDQWKPKDDLEPESWRCMIYIVKMRGSEDGMFKTFDLPDCGQVPAKRSESTTPLQALNLLNGWFVLEQAIQLNWDSRAEIVNSHGTHADIFDQPTAALLRDLKQRGQVEKTLVVWCTEFGRFPFMQANGTGRDHNIEGFTCWLMEAGVKPSFSYGATDELGWKAVDDVTILYDFNATILHLLGLDHTRLSSYLNGTERRLTDVHGHVIHEITA